MRASETSRRSRFFSTAGRSKRPRSAARAAGAIAGRGDRRRMAGAGRRHRSGEDAADAFRQYGDRCGCRDDRRGSGRHHRLCGKRSRLLPRGGPGKLVESQSEHWDPSSPGRTRRFRRRFPGTLRARARRPAKAWLIAFCEGLCPHDALRLSGMHVITTLTGSALIALAIVREWLSADAAWKAAHVDEDYQMSLWGEDREALPGVAAAAPNSMPRNRSWSFSASAPRARAGASGVRRLASTLSIRRPSRSTTSNRQPLMSMCSPVLGMCCS